MLRVRHARWPERGVKCQSCGEGSHAPLQLWVVEDRIRDARLLCYECAVRFLTDTMGAGVELKIEQTTLYELNKELAAPASGQLP